MKCPKTDETHHPVVPTFVFGFLSFMFQSSFFIAFHLLHSSFLFWGVVFSATSQWLVPQNTVFFHHVLYNKYIFEIFLKFWVYARTAPVWTHRLLENLKTLFFSRYSKFLMIGNWYWSKTSPKFFSKKIPTITVARAVQNLGRNGPLGAGGLSKGKIFFIKLAQICDEQMVKISERYLKPLLSNSKLTKFHWSR